MASCLLISPNQITLPYPVYPLGVAHLLGALTAAGHEARHYDLLSHGGLDGLRQLLQEHSFDLVGLSIRNIDTVDSNDPQGVLGQVSQCLELVRQKSSAPVVLGGAGFSIMPETLLEYLGGDYGIIGEGEELLPWLLGEISADRPLSKRLWSAPQLEACWGRPCYDQTACDYYTRHGGMVGVQTKRGCPMRCAYCSYPFIEGKRLRLREPEEVAAEVARLQQDHGARYIFFTDGVFNDAGGHFRLVAEALIRQKNTLPWCAYFRPQNITATDLKLLKRAGLAALELGSDASTDATLAGLAKGFCFSEVRKANELVVAAGLPCAHFVMFGGPEETDATLAEGIANIKGLNSCVAFAFAGIRILPGTALQGRAIAEGIIAADDPLIEPTFYFSPALGQQKIDHTLRATFANRLNRVYPCAEAEGRIGMLHRLGHVGPLWDLLIPRQRG